MRTTISLAILGSVAMLSVDAANAQQQQQPANETQIGEVVVTGTRKAGLSPAETLSPVAEINGDLISNQGSFDLTDSLTKVVSSLNTQRFPIADGTAFVRPVSLRNLSPDHVLVMVDGSREHRSAVRNKNLKSHFEIEFPA